jgi:hypothetical protein
MGGRTVVVEKRFDVPGERVEDCVASLLEISLSGVLGESGLGRAQLAEDLDSLSAGLDRLLVLAVVHLPLCLDELRHDSALVVPAHYLQEWHEERDGSPSAPLLQNRLPLRPSDAQCVFRLPGRRETALERAGADEDKRAHDVESEPLPRSRSSNRFNASAETGTTTTMCSSRGSPGGGGIWSQPWLRRRQRPQGIVAVRWAGRRVLVLR